MLYLHRRRSEGRLVHVGGQKDEADVNQAVVLRIRALFWSNQSKN